MRAVALTVVLALMVPTAFAESSTTVTKIRADEVATGKKVRLNACMGIPLTDNDQEQNELFVLFDCGMPREKPDESKIMFGKFVSAEPIKTLAAADLDFSGEIRGTFIGKLAKTVLPGESALYHVLEVDRIENAVQRER